jgi:predicted nucleic acid-binding protein
MTFARIAAEKIKEPVFLDTTIFIYLFENHPRYAPLLQFIFDQKLVKKTTSVVTVSEVLVNPIEEKDLTLENKYKEIFHHLPNLSIVCADFTTALMAADIKARFQFKLIDAFQIAMAVQNQCKTFLTNDKKLSKYNKSFIICLDKLLGL